MAYGGMGISLLIAAAVLCATPELLRAQSIAGPETPKAPTDPTEVLRMLRDEWGIDASDGADGEAAHPRVGVGDELIGGLADSGASAEILIAALQRGAKLLNPGRFAEEHRVAIKKAGGC